MKWKDIKVAALQKMFAADGNDIPSDDSVTDYIASMPQAANEALLLLSTSGKFIIKHVCVAHNPVPNLIGDSLAQSIKQIVSGNVSYSGHAAQSYYFEMVGVGTVDVIVDGTTVETISNTEDKKYVEHRGLITNTSGKDVELKITATYPCAVKNVALYAANYASADDVGSYAEYIRYPMDELAEDFYQLDNEQIYYEGDNNTHRYIQATDYFQEGNKYLVLPRDVPGNYTIYYKAYPCEITSETEDDYELPLDPEVAVLLPGYIASQVYKDDDNGIATSYRNEFEVARAELTQKSSIQGAVEFVSESGW